LTLQTIKPSRSFTTSFNIIKTVALEAQRGNINHGKKSFYSDSKSESAAKAKLSLCGQGAGARGGADKPRMNSN